MRRRELLYAAAGTLSLPAVARRSTAQSRYEPLGRVPLDGATEVVTSDDGRTAFLAATTGFGVVDLSDPQNPRVLADRRELLADRENGPLRDIRDAKLAGDRLIVVGPANPGAGINAMVLYDVSDPANPERVAVHETDYAIHNAFLTDSRAYLSQFDGDTVGMTIVDIEDDDPERVGRWSILNEPNWGEIPLFPATVHDIWVQDGTAYIAHWDAGTWLVDVRDPSNPTAITRVGGLPPDKLASLSGEALQRAQLVPPGNSHYVTVDDDAAVMGVGVESWAVEGEGGPGGITLWDIESPQNPEELATIDPPPTPAPSYGGLWTTAHNFDLANGRLYSSWYRGGVKIHDVSDPANPEEIARWRRSQDTSFWATVLGVPGEFFVGCSWNQYGELPQAYLYTFPDRAGPVPESTATAATGRNATANRNTTTANGSVPTATGSAGGAEAASNETADGGSAGAGPGFGVPAALGGVGLAAWRYLRRDDESKTR
ncbi:LVIVD repeat-containing protein [Halococcus saccharolyticus]|uniref:LVIVD repeat-containing protein n=1 Tax=Halococcus saccharolyticus DSM 5350 TaxID=1227455 RepID=M0MKQ5_9EURY|nr:hypothetical protein [Halococcus saccharolyticus]EMA46251.1 hypothetical protein C449_04440 [Halococcus saccharolyticus DSM 5350]